MSSVTAREADPVDALVERLRAGRPLSGDQFEALLVVLRMWLSRRALPREDLDEVAADAVIRLVTAVEQGRLDPERPAGAWLRVVADHLALDLLKRKQRRPSTVEFDERAHDMARNDERIVALLDENAAGADIARLMRAFADADRQDVVRVVATWLDLAEFDGVAPSTRRVAERMGISHASVQRMLNAFKAELRA